VSKKCFQCRGEVLKDLSSGITSKKKAMVQLCVVNVIKHSSFLVICTTNLGEHLERLHPSLLINPSGIRQSPNDNADNPDEVNQNAPVALPSTSTNEAMDTAACAPSPLLHPFHPPTTKRKRQLKLYESIKGCNISENEQAEIDFSRILHYSNTQKVKN
jgi:hypothetical protein